jgi:hypothetical protein
MFSRKVRQLVGGAVAVVALACPPAALAWYDAGTLVTENKTISFTGSWKFSGEVGTLNCSSGVNGTGVLEAGGGGHTGKVETFGITNPGTNCKVEGGLKTLGCTSINTVTPTTPWIFHVITSSDDITITQWIIHFRFFGGFFCPKEITIVGQETLTPSMVEAMSTATISGTLIAEGSGTPPSSGTTSGTWNITPSGTYGLTK